MTDTPGGPMFANLDESGQRAYFGGMAHAYTSVFAALGIELDAAKTPAQIITVTDVSKRVRNQWREIEAMIAVEGVLE